MSSSLSSRLRPILSSEGLTAGSGFGDTTKLDFHDVQGYEGFTDQIRQLDELNTEAAMLKAQIDAAVGPLVERKSKLDKKMKRIHDQVKKDYKDSLTVVGNITIQRKTKLVEAEALLKVTTAKATLNKVNADLLSAVTAKYGAEVAAFIASTQAELQESKKSMRIAFKGFELEQKAEKRAASIRDAGRLGDLLSDFQSYMTKSWKKLIGFAKNMASRVTKSSKRVDSAHADLMGMLKDL